MEKESRRIPPIAADYLNGISPRARAIEKRKKIIDWLYRWGFSSGPLLTQVGGAKQSVVGKLVKSELIIATRTEAGGITWGMPTHYYTLTEMGLNEATGFAMKLLRAPEVDDRYKVTQMLIRHNLIAQNATINALNSGTIIDYETERQSDNGDKSGQKRPDVIWFLPKGGKIGIEVELSPKWDRRLDEFVTGIAISLRPDENGLSRFDRVHIFTDSPSIIERYKSAMQPGENMQFWKKNSRQHWEVEKTHPVPKWLIERIDFSLIKE